MVHKPSETRLDRFDVADAILRRDGQTLFTFPTPICEVARLDERLFVIVHPYAPGDPVYSGTNLWCISIDGMLLWKAPNANELYTNGDIEFYRGITVFDPTHTKLRVGMWDDYRYAVLDALTGNRVQGIQAFSIDGIKDSLVTQGRAYLMPLAMTPPERSQFPQIAEARGPHA